MLYGFLHFFAPLATPIGFIWFLLLAFTAFCLKRRKWRWAVLPAALAAVISLIGSRIPLRLVGTLERPYIRASLADVPACDAVVMLGGGHEISRNDPLGFNLTKAADRILVALELMRLNKGGVLVFGGRGYDAGGKEETEAQALQPWLASWQIPTAPVICLKGSADTHDEAVQVQALAKERGWKRVALVTSAAHMRRAEATFRRCGVEVEPVACDFRNLGTPHTDGFNPFPEAVGFDLLEIYAHEKIGWWAYRLRGWIGDAPKPEAGKAQLQMNTNGHP
jgi:uncharacterized SAM-binding protein YcdF (DUF218 family)